MDEKNKISTRFLDRFPAKCCRQFPDNAVLLLSRTIQNSDHNGSDKSADHDIKALVEPRNLS
ncbi:MAG: hypothetical protein H6937_07475 [Burkholderiales bacterium]|nr:hypothetical protein [Burkholderiales bacterium]